MRTYEESLRVWGARKLELPDNTERIEVQFDFDVSCFQGCETCGPEHEEEFAARIYRYNSGGHQIDYLYVDLYNDYTGVIGELFKIAGEV